MKPVTALPLVLGLGGILALCSQARSEPQFDAHGTRLPVMVRIKGGEFLMGSPVSDKKSYEYHEDERPQRKVVVDDFYLARFPVTTEEFCVFLNERGNDGFLKPGYESMWTIEEMAGRYRPRRWVGQSAACWITWTGAQAYCSWISENTGISLRLPTEAEWEYAARGLELRAWPWGEESPEVAGSWRHDPPFFDEYGYRWMYKPYAANAPLLRAPVGSFPRNATPDGVLDMLGNYSGEWCSDVYRVKTEGQQPAVKAEPQRVVRGAYKKSTDVTMGDILEEKKKANTLLEMVAEPSMPQSHEGYSWTRVGQGERTGKAVIRLAMDAKDKEGQ